MNFCSLRSPRAAAPWLLALAAPLAASLAHATSAASASLSFNIVAGPGFTWLTSPVSAADSAAAAAPLTGFDFAAGVFSPAYGAGSVATDLPTGVGIPGSTATANATGVFGSASTRSTPATAAAPAAATLAADALVADAGRAEATGFARSWFSLAPGASVSFQGALLLSATGSNPAFPASYGVGDFYSFASGLLAVGSSQAVRELGGPASTGRVGNYSLNDFGPLTLNVTNTTGSLLVTYLDSGVTVYSASAVPEPGSYALLLAGVGALALFVRRKPATV